MPNIKLSYLYRDGANYKNYNHVVFANPSNINLSQFEILIKSKLIYGEWFYAKEWKLPELFLQHCDFEVDPDWHEFKKIEYTDEPANREFFIEELREIIEKTNWKR